MVTEILHLSFRLMTEKTFQHSMDSSLLISDVKALIETDSEIAPENQRLIFKGQLLKDECTLRSYGVESGSTIHVVGRVAAPPSEGQEGAASAGQAGSAEGSGHPGSEGQAGGSRPFGFPMGMFMSPIYATISVSTPVSNNSDGSVEQVASQFFSGVVNSFISTFNGPSNQAAAGDAAEPQEDELIKELEHSGKILSKISKSLKNLNSASNNSTPARPASVTEADSSAASNSEVGAPNPSHAAGATSAGPSGTATSSFDLQSAAEVDGKSVSHAPNALLETAPAPALESSARSDDKEDAVDSFAGKPQSRSASEELEGRRGKVILMDPEVLSGKLPWGALKRLENYVLHMHNGPDSSVSYSRSGSNASLGSSRSVAFRSPSATPFGSSVLNEASADVEPAISLPPASGLTTLNPATVNDVSPSVPPGFNGHDSSTSVGGPSSEDAGAEYEGRTFEDFTTRLQACNTRMRSMMRDHDKGDSLAQIERFKSLSNAMAIRTRIDAHLCAIFSWMQTQMVSPERGRVFSTRMGWSAPEPTTTPAPETTQDTHTSLPFNPFNRTETHASTIANSNQSLFANIRNHAYRSVVQSSRSRYSSNDSTPLSNDRRSPTNTFEQARAQDGNQDSAAAALDTGVTRTATPFSGNLRRSVSSSSNEGTVAPRVSATNPFVTHGTNPGGAGTSSTPGSTSSSGSLNPFAPSASEHSSVGTSQRPQAPMELDAARGTARAEADGSSRQAELLNRYRENPEFASRMDQVRHTNLGHSYHKP